MGAVQHSKPLISSFCEFTPATVHKGEYAKAFVIEMQAKVEYSTYAQHYTQAKHFNMMLYGLLECTYFQLDRM